MNNTALIETAKSIARGVWFALLGVVALILTVIVGSPEIAAATVTVPVLNITLSVGALIVAGVGFLLKALDRYRHKSDSPSNGLAPSFLQK